jgi:hypothetical protein
VIEDTSLPPHNEIAMGELQRHMEHLFRKAGDSPEVTRLRLAVLSYRLSRNGNGVSEQPK